MTVEAIEPALPSEAVRLEQGELERFIAAVAALPADAWSLPTRDHGRTVHGLIAHVAGSYAAQAHLFELRRQTAPRVIRFYHSAGESLAETIARIQVGDRRTRSPEQLIAELSQAGPRAIGHREALFRPLGLIGRITGGAEWASDLPLGPLQAVRDLWFHRLDLADATGTAAAYDRDQDPRLVELLVRSVGEQGSRGVGSRAVDLIVTGEGGGRWRFGQATEPTVEIEMTPLIFAKWLRKRLSAAGIRERSRVEGDVRAAMNLLLAVQSGRSAGR